MVRAADLVLARFKGRFDASTLDRVVRAMGWLLIGFGVWFAVRFFRCVQAHVDKVPVVTAER